MPVPTSRNNVDLLQQQAWRIPEDWLDTYNSVSRPGLALTRICPPNEGDARAFLYSDGLVRIGPSTRNPRAEHQCASLEEAVQFINVIYDLGELK